MCIELCTCIASRSAWRAMKVHLQIGGELVTFSSRWKMLLLKVTDCLGLMKMSVFCMTIPKTCFWVSIKNTRLCLYMTNKILLFGERWSVKGVGKITQVALFLKTMGMVVITFPPSLQDGSAGRACKNVKDF